MTQLQIINQLPVFRTVEPENKVKVTDFIRFYISQNITAKASWVNAHELCCRKIEDFEAFYNAKLYTHNASAINLMKFVEYLQSKHLTPGYISGTLGKIKSMLTTAALYGCPVDPTYKKASVVTEIPETVALTSGEVAIIENFKGLTKKQAEIRDIFIFGCLVGQRYSDYSKMSGANIATSHSMQIRQKKTGTIVNIPYGERAKKILDRYHGSLPPIRSIQQFNRMIKIVAKKAGITDNITISKIKGNEYITLTLPKYQLVSSHTARRTFATVMSQNKQCQIEDIQLLLGHSNINTTMRYVKRDSKAIAQSVSFSGYFNTY